MSPAARRKLRRAARNSTRQTWSPDIESLEPRTLLSTLSFWGDSTTPATASQTDDLLPYELGLKFYSDVPGNIVGIRFYKGDQQATHTVSLWDPLGSNPPVALASATSTTETAAGWQQVNFATPYSITANTPYIASYYVPHGQYACNQSYFVGSGVDNGPLHASYSGGSPSLYAEGSGRPSTATATNFWVDVVFEPNTSIPPSVSLQSPAPNATGVATSASVSGTFTEPVNPNTIVFELRDSSNTLVPGAWNYNSSTNTVTLTPTSPLAGSSTYTATISAATDLTGQTMASPVSWSFTTAASFSGTISLWDDSATPAFASYNDASAIEVGVKFQSSISGYITGIRFYKGNGNSGQHIGNLWSSTGTNLATATFIDETTSGWQTVMFSSPVPISADTTYVASYHTNAGFYAVTSNYFASAFSNGPLTALAGSNGVFATGSASTFPTSSYNSTNYWVDVIFAASVAPVGPDVTPATTFEDTQSTSGLVITTNPAGSYAVTHFKITGITNGTLYLSDGLTPVNDGDFITLAQGAAGLKFTPSPNFSGTAGFGVQAAQSNSDSILKGLITSASITVIPVNDAPVLSGAVDLPAIDEDAANNPGTLVSDLIAGKITDIDAGAVQGIAVIAVDNAHGVWQYTTDGGATWTDFGTPAASSARLLAADAGTRVRFVPAANWNGTVSSGITFQAWDQSSGAAGTTADASSSGGNTAFSSATATASITVNPVNDAPVAKDDAYSMTGDTSFPAQSSVLANDEDVENDPLTAVLVTGTAHGKLVFNADGSFTYTPKSGFSGFDSFTYQASDGQATSNIATVTIAIGYVNHAPTAVSDSYNTDEDTSLTIAAPGLLGNDTDVDGDQLIAIVDAKPSHGTLTFNADGSFAYTPAVNYHGTDSFTYKISDGELFSNTATVTITVNSVDDAPVANNDHYSTNEDTPLTIPPSGTLGNDTDVDGDQLIAIVDAKPSHGQLTLNADGSFTYTPDANFNGKDSFTYRASDGTLTSDPATVTIAVAAVNDPPVAKHDNVTTAEDTPLELSPGALLGNDSDVDGDPLSIVSASGASHGVVQVANGKILYNPDPNFFGNDSFIYKISDGHGGTATASVSVAITPLNDDPPAVNDTYAINEDSGTHALPVLDNDVAANPDPGEVLTIVGVSQGAHGTVAITGGGTGLSYTPDPDFSGTDTFTYTIEDGTGTGRQTTATVIMTVQNINDAPVASNDSYSTDEDVPLTISTPGVLTNDTDVDGDALTAVLLSGPSHGTLTLNANGSFTYQPASNYYGPDSFTYKTSDGQLQSGTATVTLTVNPVNDPPVARDDTKTAWEDLPQQILAMALLVNDSDVEGDPLTVTSVGPADHGTVQFKGGQITYQAAPNYFGTDRFTYTISDGHGGISSASVILQVTPLNDDPVAVNGSFTIDEDSGPVSLLILANDNMANPDPGESLVIATISSPAHGTATVLGNAAVLQYSPAHDFAGTDTLTYVVQDPAGRIAVGKVTIVVRNVNDPPVANDDSKTVAENAVLEFPAGSLLANDIDVDGNPLTVKAVGLASHGTVVLKDGTVTYTPAKDFHGTDAFSYTISDPSGATSTAQVKVTVAEVIQNPVAGDDSQLAIEDTVLTIPVAGLLANDIDPNGDPLSVVAVSPTAQTRGTVQLKDGQVIFTPAENFNGVTSFSYTVSDGHAGTAVGTVTVQVNAVNDPPVLAPIPDPLATDEGKAIAFQATASDVEGDQLTFSLVDAPSGATIDPATGAFSWTPGDDQAGTYHFFVRVTDNGTPILNDDQAVTITVKDVPPVEPILQVQSLTPTPSGFDIQFNRPIDLAKLNLYNGLETKDQAADLTIVGQSSGPITGTAIWEPASNTLHFVKTGGVLAADTYAATLFSRADAFASLDGDGDGQAGGNYVKTVTVAPAPAPIISLPDIARGPKQNLTLPIRVNDAAGAMSLRGELRFDPKLLNVSEIVPLASGWVVTTQVLAAGRIQFTASATQALNAPASDLLQVQASVPADAPYGAAGMLKLVDLKVNDKPALGDTAVQAVAYFGDASGNQRYGGLDAALIANAAVGACSGFDAYPLIDPLIIGDVTGNGSLGGLDAA
ncbi:MAG: Ig-like domain-containing protein, partial [Bacillota bacterium]